jgi:DNA-binding NarL/FixJ family response regulator
VCIVDPTSGSYLELQPEDLASLRTLAAKAPVVVTTGREWATQTQAANLGVSAILHKPYDLEVLAQTIDTLRN